MIKAPMGRREPKPIREPKTLEHWAASAMPGSLAEYHRGHLAANRAGSGPRTESERERIASLAGIAFRLWLSGRVHLVQRRISGGFAYLAIARRVRSTSPKLFRS